MFIKKSYKSTDEFYTAVGKPIKLFQLHGYETEAKRLDRILHGVWTTGSELIGELMRYLEIIKVNQPSDVKKLKDECHYFAKHHRKILGLD